MNHLGDLRNYWIVDCEPQTQRLKCRCIALMGKIGLKHVEGDFRTAPRFLCGNLECCLGVAELPYEPR